MEEVTEDGLLDCYICKQPIEAHWRRIKPPLASNNEHLATSDHERVTSGREKKRKESWPGMRGGHSMCIDAERGQ